MAEKLTVQQQTAVSNRGGKLLVSAAAGSGKTKVLVDRLLSYILDPVAPANLDDFLIITFTKAAAAELRGKIASKLSEKIAEMPENRHLQKQVQRLYLAPISTVHSFCSDILREYAYRLDISADFRIAEDKECTEMQLAILEKVLDSAYETLGTDPDFCAFIDTQGLGRDDYLIPQIILSTYNNAKCHLNPDGWLDWCIDAFQNDEIKDASQTVWGKYLIDDLHNYLNMHISALNRCVRLASGAEQMDGPVALLLSTITQLQKLHDCDSWDEIVANRNIEYGRLTFPKNCKDLELIDRIKYVRNACKKGISAKLDTFADCSETVLQDLQRSASAARGLVKLVRLFSEAYDKCKRSRRVMDYSDLEHKMLDLLLSRSRDHRTQVASEIGSRFREIMVDEYQDTNEVQDSIFAALTHERQNCFMVGDVKQSIYQFRLADPGIFIEKYNAYAPAESAAEGEGRKVMLSHNFRSSEGVISAVNHVFQHCMSPEVGGLYYGEEEMLREGIPHVELPEPEVELHAIDVQEDTYSEEASFVADKIAQMLDGSHMVRQGDALRPITADDIVILLRSPGSVAAHYVYALEQRGIRCTTGKGIDLLQTEEIATLRALLQVISNPLQDIPLLAVLMSPVFGFTADELASMRSRNQFANIYGLLTVDTAEKTKAFLDVLKQLRYDARLYSLSQLIQKIFVLTGFDSIYSAMSDGDVRNFNLQSFVQIVTNFETSTKRDLNQLLSYLDMMEDEGLRIGADEKLSGAVTIMSIHTSKGLEFPVVFLCALSRRFNMESAWERVLCDKELGLGLSCAETTQRVRYPSIAKRAISRKMIANSISEEMRILYVAMTRARDRLIMTYASNKLETELQSMVFGLDMYDSGLLNGYVSCAGAWVLQSALRRTEAGELFALGGNPGCSGPYESVWNIRVSTGNIQFDADFCRVEQTKALTDEQIGQIRKSLAYKYPFGDAICAPSKLTATQLKGRFKDQEAAENALQIRRYNGSFRRASFASPQVTSQTYGNAVHAVMQYIQFDLCKDENSVKQEMERLVDERFISRQQADLVEPAIISRLFQTEIGRKICNAKTLLREFKFSVLDDASHYVSELENEQVLLQGVIDCAVIDPDGIVVVDFKTDHVTEETLPAVVDRYRSQVNAYASSLEKIYRLPTKSVWLYFFHINRFVEIMPM